MRFKIFGFREDKRGVEQQIFVILLEVSKRWCMQDM
jgi:hypothetical protein